MRAIRLSTLLVCAGLALGLTACGSTKPTRFADNEGVYVDVGPLKYQVQISRQLNPYDVEDRYYLQGLLPAQAVLLPTQQWFGVFVLVMNRTAHPLLPVAGYYITDAAGGVYKPTPILGANPFAYRPQLIPPRGTLPLPGSPASTGPTGGALLLFKLPYAANNDRPLLLHIYNLAHPLQRAIVTLDV